MSDEEFPIARQILLKAEAVPTAVPTLGIYVVNFLDEDGAQCLKWHIEGDGALQELLGAIELLKIRLAASTFEWDDD